MPDRILIRGLAFICIWLVLSIVETRSEQPYQPVQSDPVREPWRWRTFPDLIGSGVQCIAEDNTGTIRIPAPAFPPMRWTRSSRSSSR